MADVRLAPKPRRGSNDRRRGDGQTHDRTIQAVGERGAIPGEPGRASAGNTNGEWRAWRARGASAWSVELVRASAGEDADLGQSARESHLHREAGVARRHSVWRFAETGHWPSPSA